MKKSVVLIGFLVVVMVFAQTLIGASSKPEDLLRDQEGIVQEIVDLIEGGEEQVAIEKLNSLHTAVVESRASLRGWVFEGSSGKRLTDPFTLPEGTYRVHFTTGGFGQVRVMPVKEDSWEMLFNLSPGEASNGASSVYRSGGEEVMIQFSNISEPYKLVLEKLG